MHGYGFKMKIDLDRQKIIFQNFGETIQKYKLRNKNKVKGVFPVEINTADKLHKNH